MPKFESFEYPNTVVVPEAKQPTRRTLRDVLTQEFEGYYVEWKRGGNRDRAICQVVQSALDTYILVAPDGNRWYEAVQLVDVTKNAARLDLEVTRVFKATITLEETEV